MNAIASLRHRGLQRGLSAIAVLAILVFAAGLAAALFRLSVSMSLGVSTSSQLARSINASKSGIQWGAYQALKGTWTTCASASQNLDLRTNTGFFVTVTCNSRTYNEGQSAPGVPNVTRIYQINAVACNGTSGTCPDASSVFKEGYVERELRATFKQ